MTALRYCVAGVLVLVIATSAWVGVRRLIWEASYQTVGLVIPYQELDTLLGEDELRDSLKELRAQGVVALSVELSSFPDWNLHRVNSDEDLLRIVRLTHAVGMGIALIADADLTAVPAPIANIHPHYGVIISNDNAAIPPWVTKLGEVTLGVVEFSEPSGLLELYRQGQRSLVRVHAIKSGELDRLGLEGALTRWQRAVQERNIRLLWVTEHRRFPQYVERLSHHIATLGMSLGQPLKPPPFESSYIIYLLIGASAIGLAVLLALRSAQSRRALIGWGGISLGVMVLAGLWNFEMARQALALIAASLSPWLLVVLFKERFSGWKLLFTVSAGSLVAGLAIGALVSDLSYFLKLNEFRGVKVALVAPSLLIVLTELWRHRELDWRALKTQLKRGAWLIPAVGLGAIFLVLERSGNLPLVPVARWEELARERLEDWLTARPRFKEFLIGHPALVLWKSDRSLSQLGVLALGALGQASVINTFVHLHTPLALSLWRTLNGLVLGVLIGITLQKIFYWLRPWRRNRSF